MLQILQDFAVNTLMFYHPLCLTSFNLILTINEQVLCFTKPIDKERILAMIGFEPGTAG